MDYGLGGEVHLPGNPLHLMELGGGVPGKLSEMAATF